jgi:hypothetical protein
VTVVAVIAAMICAGLIGWYATRYRNLGQQHYSAPASWTRAGIFVSGCWVLSVATGAAREITGQPIVAASQLHSGAWWAWTVASFVTVGVGYWVIWARWTLHFDRRRAIGAQILMGLLWGSGVGQLFVTVVHVVDRLDLPKWGLWLVSYAIISTWQGLFQDLFWDVWVSPEHDTPWSIIRKVIVTHIPNVTMTLTWFVLYRNAALWVAVESMALVGACVFMRFPPWWEPDHVLAPTTGPAFAGLIRATGYESDDPDPYATQRASDQSKVNAG